MEEIAEITRDSAKRRQDFAELCIKGKHFQFISFFRSKKYLTFGQLPLFTLYLVGGKYGGGQLSSAGLFKQSIGAKNRIGIELSYRPARLHRLAELIPWNRFSGSFKI